MGILEELVQNLEEYIGSEWITLGGRILNKELDTQASTQYQEGLLQKDPYGIDRESIGALRMRSMLSINSSYCVVHVLENKESESFCKVRLSDKEHCITAYLMHGEKSTKESKTNISMLRGMQIKIMCGYLTYIPRKEFVFCIESYVMLSSVDAFSKSARMHEMHPPLLHKSKSLQKIVGRLNRDAVLYANAIPLMSLKRKLCQIENVEEKALFEDLLSVIGQKKIADIHSSPRILSNKEELLMGICNIETTSTEAKRAEAAPDACTQKEEPQELSKSYITEISDRTRHIMNEDTIELVEIANKMSILHEIERNENLCQTQFSRDDTEKEEVFSSVEELSDSQVGEMVVESNTKKQKHRRHKLKPMPLSDYLKRKNE
ncbi:hypothetical protein NECID01_0149 [Nematocida sp. AWRm77]|nr:hypothetical protein NECID01_0149 [Nematocida sp. AWRm77]